MKAKKDVELFAALVKLRYPKGAQIKHDITPTESRELADQFGLNERTVRRCRNCILSWEASCIDPEKRTEEQNALANQLDRNSADFKLIAQAISDHKMSHSVKKFLQEISPNMTAYWLGKSQ